MIETSDMWLFMGVFFSILGIGALGANILDWYYERQYIEVSEDCFKCPDCDNPWIQCDCVDNESVRWHSQKVKDLSLTYGGGIEAFKKEFATEVETAFATVVCSKSKDGGGCNKLRCDECGGQLGEPTQ